MQLSSKKCEHIQQNIFQQMPQRGELCEKEQNKLKRIGRHILIASLVQ